MTMLRILVRLADILIAPCAAIAGICLRLVRMVGLEMMPLTRSALFSIGLLPVRRHYYEPFPNLERAGGPRGLPGIEWNLTEQWLLVDSFAWMEEIRGLTKRSIAGRIFDPHNPNFCGGDADILYSMVRKLRPRTIIEIGCGYSTLVAAQALQRNAGEGNPGRHVCVEPYEMRWLELIGVEVLRAPVEKIGVDFFETLASGDLLFIDSSHVVRAGGDVNYLILEVLPTLAPGVTVHFHDIFSPADYPRLWTDEKALLWSEQYLLEAFLSGSRDWEIVLAANYLCHQDRKRLSERLPLMESDAEPGSIYIRRKETKVADFCGNSDSE
jgi:hypothetical protein